MDLRGKNTFKVRTLNPIMVRHAGRDSRTMGAIIIDQLRPFNNTMRKQLSKKGFNVKHVPFKNLVPLYYNELVSNKNVEKNIYEPINTYEFVNHAAFFIKPKDNVNADLKDMRVLGYFGELQDVVDSTIDTFRTAKAKYQVSHFECADPRSTMTDDEITQAKAAVKVQRDLEYKALLDEPVKLITVNNVLKVAIVVLLLYYILK